MNPGDAIARSNEQVVTYSLVELLTQMVFVAMALALVMHEADTRFNPTKERVKELEAVVERQERELIANRIEIGRLKKRIALLLDRPKNDPVVAQGTWLSGPELSEYRNLKEINEELRAADRKLREQISSKTGRKILSKCTVTPKALLNIDARGDGGYTVNAAWPRTADAALAQVTGAIELGNAGAIGRRDFFRMAQRVENWGLAQPDKCRFSVRLHRRHNNGDLVVRQYQEVWDYFDAAWVR